MVIEVNTLGWKGPHVAYACGQPIGRSLNPRTQHRLATEAKEARCVASMAHSTRTSAQDARQRSVPSKTAFAHAGTLLAAWQDDNGSSSSNPARVTTEQQPAQTPKATPALDAYKASQSRVVPRYTKNRCSAEHARIRALKQEEKQLVEEIRAIDRSEQKRHARRRVPV
eukprot:COSAG02_NODE_9617_length_2159_cov_2.394660_1_plen_169_part_00